LQAVMLELIRKVLYFDEYVKDASGEWIGGNWIGLKNATTIAEYFKANNFSQMNSGELGRWMNQAISANEAEQTIVIFAQDVAPYDVFDDLSSNALIRQYLDAGGAVLWVGDIPFYYRTKLKDNYFDREDTTETGISYFNVLGVIPVSMVASSRFSITKDGRKHGLKQVWASLRPVVNAPVLEKTTSRVYNRFKRRREFVELARVEGVGVPTMRPFVRKGPLMRFLDSIGTSSFKIGPVQFGRPEGSEAAVEFA
jgi:hypothetical protein